MKKNIQNIQQILEDFEGTKNTVSIKSRKIKVLISLVRNEKDEIEASKKAMQTPSRNFQAFCTPETTGGRQNNKMEKSLLKNAAVLEETKNQLTKEGTRRKKWTKARVGEPRVKIIFEFTKQEEQTAIDSSSTERLATPRVKAEDHKGCDEETGEMLRNIFNEMIKHRPVCTLSTLCKEFSTPGSATDKQIPALRPSRIPTLFSNPGSLGDIQTARTESREWVANMWSQRSTLRSRLLQNTTTRYGKLSLEI